MMSFQNCCLLPQCNINIWLVVAWRNLAFLCHNQPLSLLLYAIQQVHLYPSFLQLTAYKYLIVASLHLLIVGLLSSHAQHQKYKCHCFSCVTTYKILIVFASSIQARCSHHCDWQQIKKLIVAWWAIIAIPLQLSHRSLQWLTFVFACSLKDVRLLSCNTIYIHFSHCLPPCNMM